ncbi:hypothetical protein BJY52DRAFT_1419827 [Lactarius psammicola]|nr:hypothetical protein BJY52DRAFT_1419827 [Lactarius psammicola]
MAFDYDKDDGDDSGAEFAVSLIRVLPSGIPPPHPFYTERAKKVAPFAWPLPLRPLRRPPSVSAPSLLSRKRGHRRGSGPPQSPPPELCHPARLTLHAGRAKRDSAPPSPLCLGYSSPALACRVAQEGQCAPPTPPLGNRPRSSVYAPRPTRAPHLCACAARERNGGRTMRGRERKSVTGVRAGQGRGQRQRQSRNNGDDDDDGHTTMATRRRQRRGGGNGGETTTTHESDAVSSNTALRSSRSTQPYTRTLGGGSSRNSSAGEIPVVILRVQVLYCRDLEAKDFNRKSDPYVIVSISGEKFQTPVCKRNLNPDYEAKDATFDFPIHASLVHKFGILKFVVWDKDRVKDDYLGEYAFPVDQWFIGNAFSFNDRNNQPISLKLCSSHPTKTVRGTVYIKVGFVHPPSSTSPPDFRRTYNTLLNHSGIVILEDIGANDLPKWSNMTHTGWDMDPFVEVSIGEEVKRTSVLSHKLNPVWEEQLLFHLTVIDRDRFSSNDTVGKAEIKIGALVEGATREDPDTWPRPTDFPTRLGFNLTLTKNPKRSYKCDPTIKFCASYQSYTALRRTAGQGVSHGLHANRSPLPRPDTGNYQSTPENGTGYRLSRGVREKVKHMQRTHRHVSQRCLLGGFADRLIRKALWGWRAASPQGELCSDRNLDLRLYRFPTVVALWGTSLLGRLLDYRNAVSWGLRYGPPPCRPTAATAPCECVHQLVTGLHDLPLSASSVPFLDVVPCTKVQYSIAAVRAQALKSHTYTPLPYSESQINTFVPSVSAPISTNVRISALPHSEPHLEHLMDRTTIAVIIIVHHPCANAMALLRDHQLLYEVRSRISA